LGKIGRERKCIRSNIIAFMYVVGANKNTEKGRKIQKIPSEKKLRCLLFCICIIWFVS
jgi:hypothetical protein